MNHLISLNERHIVKRFADALERLGTPWRDEVTFRERLNDSWKDNAYEP